MPTRKVKLIAAARVNAYAGGSPGIEFMSMYEFQPSPIRSFAGCYTLRLASPPKNFDQIVVLVTRNYGNPGGIHGTVLGSNGDIQINNFNGANVPEDSQFSIAVYQVPLALKIPVSDTFDPKRKPVHL